MEPGARPLTRTTLTLSALLGLAAFAGLMALGLWQLHRLHWKLDLIARVERQLAAAPSPAPAPGQWSVLTDDAAYRRVQVQGQFDHSRETCTQAVTELGAGCWVMTPLHTSEGWWALVNRGFVETAQRDPAMRAAGQVSGSVTISGLLRLSEPGGGFLRHNDAAGNHWYSRDVAAIAAARGLSAGEVAPYFIDAADSIEGGPVGGLTVLRFHNNHLMYALTWFALALMVLLGAFMVARREWRLRGAHSGG